MRTQIEAFGENMCIILPTELTKELNLHIGSDIEIDILNDKIEITKHLNLNSDLSLEEMLKNINESNIHDEISTSYVLGNEIC